MAHTCLARVDSVKRFTLTLLRIKLITNYYYFFINALMLLASVEATMYYFVG
jgi:hypothetical protein